MTRKRQHQPQKERMRAPHAQSPSPHELAQLRCQKWSTIAAVGTLAVSFLTLVFATWQTILARQERSEAKSALALATQARESTAQAEATILEHEQALAKLTTELEQSAQLANLHELSIRAEAGDREAFMTLQRYVWDSKSTNASPFFISFAQKHVNRIYGLFTGDQILDPGVAHGEWTLSIIWPTNHIPANLANDNYSSRASAVGTIGTMRLNSFIPRLVDMAFEEPDLYVLQLIVKTIEKAFDGCAPRSGFMLSDFLYPHYHGREKFEEQWKQFGPSILSRRPKYIVSEPLGPNSSSQTIIDPEAEQPPERDK